MQRGPLSAEAILLAAGVVATLYFARDILIPVALALTLNFWLTPVIIFLERLRFGRVPAVFMVMVAAIALVACLGWVVARQLIVVAEDLPQYRDNIHDKLNALHSPATGPMGQAIQGVQSVVDELSGTARSAAPAQLPAAAQTSATRRREERAQAAQNSGRPSPVTVVNPQENSFRTMRDLLLPVLRPLGVAGIVIVFTIYMLMKREDLRNRLLLLAGMSHLNVMTQALNDAASRISRYLAMNFLMNASYGALFGVGLFFIGIPYATLWGVLAGILRFIPYVGTLTGVVMPIFLALAAFNTWWQPLLVLALFGVLELVLSNFVEPWLYGTHTGVSSLALLISAIFWSLLWGWPGLVLSTPLTVCLIVMGRYVPQLSFLHTLLGDDAELAPQAKFYERLLAMDQAEAYSIADTFLAGKPLIDLYDQVLLPALSLAEQERHKGMLEEARAGYLFQSATELIAQLTDYQMEPPCADPDAEPRPRRGLVQSNGNGSKLAPVVCLPANDQADEIAGTMLAQLLEQCGHKTLMLPPDALSDEILERLAEEPETIVCISAVPPFAYAAARSVTARVRKHLPKNRIMIGLWDTTARGEELRERFGNTRPDIILTNLAAAVAQIQDWHSAESGAWMVSDFL
jgi:predicted PurR-regulated permease PerM